MKHFALTFFLVSKTFFAQQIEYNTKQGYVAEGYDVVAYFDTVAVKGDKAFTTEYDGADYKFVSLKNLETFKVNPKKYVPQYGGYCAYAMGDNGKKVGVDPKSFEIRDGRLYLFYNSLFSNTLKLWLKEGPMELQKSADKNWNAIMNKE